MLRLRERNASRSLGILILTLIRAEQTLSRRILKELAQPVLSKLKAVGWPCGFLVKFLNFIVLKFVKINLEFGDLYVVDPEAIPRAMTINSGTYESDVQAALSRIKQINVVLHVRFI